MAGAAQVNIIRKVEVTEGGGHHGGAWKVAYADFMTAMMAFFLLMWILASSDEQKLRGIAEYFTNATMPGGSGVLDGATLGPPGTLSASNGSTVARGSELGQVDASTPAQWDVLDTTQTSDPQELVHGTTIGIRENPAAGAASETYNSETDPETDNSYPTAGSTDAAPETRDEAQDLLHKEDLARFENLQAEMMQAIRENPDLRPLEPNIIFERTPEGLRIQVVDQEGQPMFASGSADMAETTLQLMQLLGQSLTKLPNQMIISGHTDSVPFADQATYDNWDLSSDRANEMRRVLLNTGVTQSRITRVSGIADTEPLLPEDPFDPSNRRISVLLEYRTAANTPSSEVGASTQVTEHGSTEAQPSPPGTENAPIVTVAEGGQSTDAIRLEESIFQDLRSALR